MSETGIIYKITSPCGKSYIGMTGNSLAWRMHRHASNARTTNGLLPAAIRKYGMDAMVVEVIEEVPRKDLPAAEMRAIVRFNTRWPNGLNMSDGGDGNARLIPISEIGRVAKIKATMATPEYKQKQVEIQREVWTEDRKAERAASVKAMWQDPEYRAIQKKARTKEKQPELKLVLTAEGRSRLRTKQCADPAYRAAASQKRKEWCENAENRQLLSDRQREVMEARPELKHQIAMSLSRYRGYVFSKTTEETPVSKKPSIMTRTWADLPGTVTFEELYAAGWQGRFIDRAISRGWLVVHSTKDGCGAGYAACPPKNIIYGVA